MSNFTIKQFKNDGNDGVQVHVESFDVCVKCFGFIRIHIPYIKRDAILLFVLFSCIYNLLSALESFSTEVTLWHNILKLIFKF